MDRVQPTLAWYTERSGKGAPRCPFASVHRCPRYYASVWLLGEAGITTKIDPEEDKRLFARWKESDLWPAISEQESGAFGTPERKSFRNFCPEVAFDHFGWFATYLAPHADETDMESAHRRLTSEGTDGKDWGWVWSVVHPMHYTECPLYSLLLTGPPDEVRATPKAPIGF